jgi:LPS O-antigen subunit length determinant protein (WzzB/FepE family)
MSDSPQEPISPQTRRSIRRIFLTLLAVGVIIGGVTAVGVVKLMGHFNLIGVPEQPEAPKP